MDSLKICPFCGGALLVSVNTLYYAIQHPNNECILSGWYEFVVLEYKDELIDRWNRRATGWIAVEDGLPEKVIQNNPNKPYSEAVQAWTRSFGYRIVYYDHNQKQWLDEEDGRFIQVTHWQPLPSPPEEKK